MVFVQILIFVMKIGEFLKKFREGISNQNNNKALSVAGLSVLIKVKADTIRNCERGFFPRDEMDRRKIKSFFDLETLEDIPNSKLVEILNTFDLNNIIEAKEVETVFANTKKPGAVKRNVNLTEYLLRYRSEIKMLTGQMVPIEDITEKIFANSGYPESYKTEFTKRWYSWEAGFSVPETTDDILRLVHFFGLENFVNEIEFLKSKLFDKEEVIDALKGQIQALKLVLQGRGGE